eukprot:scaffold1014_cov260-Pinguiococcus_pyrenoidosus.AAC.1
MSSSAASLAQWMPVSCTKRMATVSFCGYRGPLYCQLSPCGEAGGGAIQDPSTNAALSRSRLTWSPCLNHSSWVSPSWLIACTYVWPMNCDVLVQVTPACTSGPTPCMWYQKENDSTLPLANVGVRRAARLPCGQRSAQESSLSLTPQEAST